MARVTTQRFPAITDTPLRSFRIKRWDKVILPGGMEVIAAAPTVDGRGYMVPRWSKLDGVKHELVAEKRAKSVKKVIEDNFAIHEKRIRRGVSQFFGAYAGKTVFIVGSGPSLLANGIQLRRHPEATIFAINGALKYFKNSMEMVDFYFTLDWLGSLVWLDGIDCSGVKLITSVTTPPEILDRFPDYYHFVGMTGCRSDDTQVNRRYAYLGQLDAGLTGTYSAMHLAWRMGAKRIVLVGQDFACRYGLYHWDEPLAPEIAEARKFRVVPDLSGGVTMTDYELDRNMGLVRAAAIWCAEDGIEVVNATEGGILDWNRKPLEEVYRILEEEHGIPDGDARHGQIALHDGLHRQ